jgi:hypothetical protein
MNIPLKIYEVIFWEGDSEPDTIYVITANTHLQAAEMAERDRQDQLRRGKPGLHPDANAVCLIGESRITSPDPQIIRGPFLETGITRGETWLFDERVRKWFTHDEYYLPRSER